MSTGKWIRRADVSPTEEGVYIVSCGDAYLPELAYWEDGWIFYDDGGFNEGEDISDRAVTHWMPLPEPPKERE